VTPFSGPDSFDDDVVDGDVVDERPAAHDGAPDGQGEGRLDELIVPAVLDGDRIDRVVAMLLDIARSTAQELVASGAVLVDGRPAAKSRRLHTGERLSVPPAPVRLEQRPRAQPIEIPIRHVDDDVIVLAKPVDLVVHPAGGHPDGTLVNGLLHRFPDLADIGDPARPGIVHRLDRDTSGLMVVARSAVAYDSLVDALSRRAVTRGYLALVAGHFDTPRGVVDAPIGRAPRNRERMAVVRGGRDARTGFEVREVFDRWSLVECRLETGRTHQIRVHLQAVGHPVAGDAAYGGQRGALGLSRQFLHAHRLAFEHPVTGAWMEFDEPLPDDLVAVLDALRC
jgi:23S rRNA pseudouridine1911/1915/1917 synthase